MTRAPKRNALVGLVERILAAKRAAPCGATDCSCLGGEAHSEPNRATRLTKLLGKAL